jgi:ADP-heptose:LPS heptosyltransferase
MGPVSRASDWPSRANQIGKCSKIQSSVEHSISSFKSMYRQIRRFAFGLSYWFWHPRDLPRDALLAAQYVWNVKVRRKDLVAVLRLGGVGDLACVLASIPGLRKRHPNSWLVLITPPACWQIAASSGLADVTADRDGFLHRLAERAYSAGCYYRPLLPDERSPPEPRTLHLADEFARALGVTADLSRVGLRTPDRVRQRLTRRLREVNPDRRPMIVLHPGPTWPVREWPTERWHELAHLVSRNTSAVTVKIGTDTDSMGRLRPLAAFPDVVDWTNQLDVTETVALLEQADALVGIDSGPLHIAGILGLPAVALFGPTFSHLTLHPRSRATVITGDVDCLGCHHAPDGQLHWRTGCPHNIACMNAISAEDVFTALRGLQTFESSLSRTCRPK